MEVIHNYEPMPKVPDLQVPKDLLQQQHDANTHFHEARVGLEKALEACEDDHQEHIEKAADKLRRVEHNVEEIDLKISEKINQMP